LTEVAPGIDLERDILARMDFAPIVDQPPRPMNPALFDAATMGLRERLLSVDVEGRIHHDAARDLLFLDFRHLHLKRPEHVQRIREAVERTCSALGRKVAAVVNYDGFQLDDEIAPAYAAMAHEMHQRFYLRVSRYADGAFRRLRLAKQFTGVGEANFYDDLERATRDASDGRG
jgi:propionate CoA-transferase